MKVLLLNGGGLESLALSIILKHSLHEVTSLHIDCGYLSSPRTKVAAKLIADTYCNSHVDIALSGLPAMGRVDPTLNRYQPFQYQQLVLSSIGASYAQMNGLNFVSSGFRHRLLSKEFKTQFTNLLREVKLAGLNPLELTQPLLDLNMTDEALYNVIKDSPILHDTVSCLEEPACGTCSKCVLRAFYNI